MGVRTQKLTETRRLPRRPGGGARPVLAVAVTLTVLLSACAESEPPASESGADADDTGAIDVSFDSAPADVRDQGGDTTASGDTGGPGDALADSASDADAADAIEDSVADILPDADIAEDTTREPDVIEVEVLRVETPYLMRNYPVVLGRGETARVETLDDDGVAEFDAPGPGPYTVTVVLDSRRLTTAAGETGPVVELGSALGSGLGWTTGGDWTVEGTVTGATTGDRVTVTLLTNGSVYDEVDVANDGSYAFSSTLIPQEPVVMRALAAEWSGEEVIRLGAATISDAFVGTDVGDADVALDDPVSTSLTLDVSNLDPAGGDAFVRYQLMVDGRSLWPGQADIDQVTGSHTLTTPSFAGSLAEFGATASFYTQGYANRGLVGSRGQLAVSGDVSGRTETLDLPLLDLPSFVTEVGETRESATELAGEQVVLALQPAAGADTNRLIVNASGGCRYFWWELRVPGDATAVETFELPASLEVEAIPAGFPIELTLFSVREGEVWAIESADTGWAALTGGPDCADLPDWAVGDFEAVTRSDGGICQLRGHHLQAGRCGRYSSRFFGGDFIQLTCGTAEVVGAAEVRLNPEATWPAGLFSGSETVLAEPGATFRGFDTLDATGETSDLTVTWVQVVPPEAAAVPESVVGSYEGVSVVDDLLADDAGSPGAVVEAGTPLPADGSDPSVGTMGASLEADGSLSAWISFFFFGSSRQGVIDEWDGDSGEVQFLNADGICSDDTGRGALSVPEVDRLELVTTRRVTDVDDADGDGEHDDFVFERRTVTFAADDE
jgi:hypothetical protein